MRARSSVFRHHDFRLLAAGQTLSWLGDGFQPVALAVAVVTQGGSAGDLGIPLAANMAGRVIFTLLGGVFGDRLQPVRVMAAADVVRAVLAAVVAVLFASGSWNPWSLAALMFASGAAAAFFHPSFATLKPRVVPDGEQQAANAMLGMIATAARVGGPAFAGVVVAVAGAPAGFAINAVTYLWSVGCVLRIRTRPARAVPGGLASDLRDGLGAVLRRPWLAAGIASAGLYHVGNGVLLVLLPVIAVQRLGGATAVGATQAAMGAGAFLGGLLVHRVRPRRPIVVGWLVLVLTGLSFLTLARPESLAVVAGCIGIGAGALMFFGVIWETAMQREVPPEQLGRVSAWDQVTSFALFPLGNLLAGPLTTAYGVGPVVVACVGILVLSALLPLLVRDTWRVAAEPRSADTPAPLGMVT